MTRSATISGVGSTLPPRLVPNTWFEDTLDTNDEWIRERTGIEARHFVEEGVDTSDLVVEAAIGAMETAAIAPDQLDLIVVASVTGDTPFPATAVWAQEKLGLRVPAFDVNAACAGFSYGLATATAFVQAGMADTVLLVGAEIFSRILDFTDRETDLALSEGIDRLPDARLRHGSHSRCDREANRSRRWPSTSDFAHQIGATPCPPSTASTAPVT